LSAGEGANITNTGEIVAQNADGSGGEILIDGGTTGTVDIQSGRVSADGRSGRNGGSVTVLGREINVGPTAEVTADGLRGGTIQLGAPGTTSSLDVQGKVSASGTTVGGEVNLYGASVSVTGDVLATGGTQGGRISV
ncbi:MAG: hypothetical protein HKN23_10120, partial [Verrucomicrobiales bacterium]|nr:hypothetical protein [Verrucomicrobiales bacterium]